MVLLATPTDPGPRHIDAGKSAVIIVLLTEMSISRWLEGQRMSTIMMSSRPLCAGGCLKKTGWLQRVPTRMLVSSREDHTNCKMLMLLNLSFNAFIGSIPNEHAN
jgi:hypothetical protein